MKLGLLIPSLGRAAVECGVGGRGLCVKALEETPPFILPLGGNRTGPTFFQSCEYLTLQTYR